MYPMFRPVSLHTKHVHIHLSRRLTISASRNSKLDLAKEYDSLKLAQVPELPIHKTVPLVSQSFKGKTEIDAGKTPVVLLHGLFGALQNYRTVGRQICAASNRQVVGVDLRNHGSSPHAAPHDYMHMTHDMIEHVEKLGSPVILAGHSMGAKVAMLVSLLRPELVEKLVVIDNSPASEVLGSQFTRDLLGMCHVERDRSLRTLSHAALPSKIDKILLKYEKDPLVRVFLMSNIKRRASKHDNSPVTFRVPVLNFLKHNVLKNLGEWPEISAHYDGPVKVMRGLRSDFVTDTNIERDFPRYFSDFRVTDFDSGHWLVSEQPDKFVEEMLAFIET